MVVQIHDSHSSTFCFLHHGFALVPLEISSGPSLLTLKLALLVHGPLHSGTSLGELGGQTITKELVCWLVPALKTLSLSHP